MKTIFSNFIRNKNNVIDVVANIFKIFNIQVLYSTIQKDLLIHPDYPSLLSVSDILTKYGVYSVSMNIDISKINKLEPPFISQLKNADGKPGIFTIVKNISEENINYLDFKKNNWISTSLEDYKKQCTGIILFPRVSEHTGEKDYTAKLKAERVNTFISGLYSFWIPLMILISGLIYFKQSGTNAIIPIGFSILSLTGTLICILLLIFEIDQYNPLLQQICSTGKKVNCNAILSSSASKIGGISYSTIGFSFFCGNLLSFLFLGLDNPHAIFCLACTNLLAAPFIFYSVYYQWQVAKQWCLLCLIVQGIIFSQLVLSLAGGILSSISPNMITFHLIMCVATAYIIPFTSARILMPALLQAKDGNEVNVELQRLKQNPQIFEALLEKQKAINLYPEGLGIVLGSPQARYKIIKVCNPYCGPCARAHIQLEEIIDNNPNFQLQIIFSVTNQIEDYRNKPVKHFLALSKDGTDTVVKKALDDWYNADVKDYSIFSEQYPIGDLLEQQDEKIEAMHAWCKNNEIEFTPTFFISIPTSDGENSNFHQLPGTYKIADLKYFLSI